MESPNIDALVRRLHELGAGDTAIERMLHTFNAWAEPFRSAGSQRTGEPVRAAAREGERS